MRHPIEDSLAAGSVASILATAILASRHLNGDSVDEEAWKSFGALWMEHVAGNGRLRATSAQLSTEGAELRATVEALRARQRSLLSTSGGTDHLGDARERLAQLRSENEGLTARLAQCETANRQLVLAYAGEIAVLRERAATVATERAAEAAALAASRAEAESHAHNATELSAAMAALGAAHEEERAAFVRGIGALKDAYTADPRTGGAMEPVDGKSLIETVEGLFVSMQQRVPATIEKVAAAMATERAAERAAAVRDRERAAALERELHRVQQEQADRANAAAAAAAAAAVPDPVGVLALHHVRRGVLPLPAPAPTEQQVQAQALPPAPSTASRVDAPMLARRSSQQRRSQQRRRPPPSSTPRAVARVSERVVAGIKGAAARRHRHRQYAVHRAVDRHMGGGGAATAGGAAGRRRPRAGPTRS